MPINEISLILGNTQHGPMLYDPTDGCVGYSFHKYGEYSYSEQEIFRQLLNPELIAIDIGAQVGAHSIAMAKLCKAVYAIESNPTTHRILVANVAMNYQDYDEVNQEGIYPILCTANATTLNDLLYPSDFIKIDVDGPEAEIILGGKIYFKEYSPWLYMENDRPERARRFVEAVYEIGYTPYWHLAPLYREPNFRGVPVDAADLNVASLMMLCSPPGKEIRSMIRATPTGAERVISQVSDKTWVFDLSKEQ
jgi:hypothetical protein